MPPTTVVIPSPSPTPNQQQNDNNSPDTKGLIAPIVGGILGGFFGLIGIVVLIWYIWRKRAVILSRSPSPLPDISQMSYTGRSRTQMPDPTIEPKPYRYGGLGSTNSYGGSRPGTIRRSSMYSSHSPPPTSPHSYAGSPSPRLSSFSQGGAPTPPLLAGTALNPGPSQPSSRPSTPGYFSPHPHQGPPSAYRQSWPLFGAAGEEDRESQVDVPGSPTFGMRNERRPSRLSLTLANWNPGAEEEGRTGSRSVSMSMSGMSAHGGIEAAPRSETASLEGEPDSRSPRTTTLFVVNSDELSKAPT
ncbi:hypothetical protein PHLCEN_2v6737 [Hermanssonia centrifuga]|uniref:Uncharacterized protein n=1 Tax=Hermanssonia centrifuga TaxID=98765 RepID=A0A2R6NYL4_9APHY|nr:hypothetical protein PHLCEN_2v6737 [Hermanssonia centrifuga]